ncbi:MAG: hypothetical protein AAF403_06425, partial [Pseudomonadota bacterium]
HGAYLRDYQGQNLHLLTYMHLARINQLKRDFKCAESFCKKIIEQHPDHKKVHFLKGQLALVQGDYTGGWLCIDQFMRVQKMCAAFAIPRWQGESLKGKNLLILGEENLNLSMMTLRLLSALFDMQTGEIAYCGPSHLHALLVHNYPNLNLIDSHHIQHDQLADFYHYYIDQLCIGHHLNWWVNDKNKKFLPLSVNHQRMEQIDNLLESYVPASKARIALAWCDQRSAGDLPSQQLHPFANLLKFEQYRFISVQSGDIGSAFGKLAEQEIRPLEILPDINFQHDIEGMCALIKRMDLLITRDPLLGHLGGIMGVPTWLLIPYYYDWYWHQCHCYQNVQLFHTSSATGDILPLTLKRICDLLTHGPPWDDHHG